MDLLSHIKKLFANSKKTGELDQELLDNIKSGINNIYGATKQPESSDIMKCNDTDDDVNLAMSQA